MTEEKLFLADVLGCFIRNEKLNFDRALDIPELIRLSDIHSVAGILGYMALQSPSTGMKPYEELLKRQCFASEGIAVRRMKKAEELISALNGAGIDHMLFKGFVLRNSYPVPELRSFGDIDILIKPEDRRRCHELMLSLGFAVGEDWEPVYSYHKGIELYELHTKLVEINVTDADCREYFNSAWEHSVNVGGHSFVPQPELHFIYLLAHIAKHIRGEGAGIRMYLDLAAFIRHYGDAVDWRYVDEKLEDLKLKELANMALTLCEKCFGVPSPIALHKLDETVFEDFLDYTLDGGAFGSVGRDSGLITLKKAQSGSRTATLLRRFFPPAESIESRYTYLQERPWLLPAAWVHRVFKNRSLWKMRASEVRSIIKTDEADVERLKRIYKETGL